ncbi:sulfite exporter TauE/SafE family protein [Schumannella soli]|uniref:sulfite exporter TauE/SafE family protein n=1 Tax=Schumannella soli TaxID=2590779 RepID=UPI002104B87C|nr:sulfite exporter TauE/SafE family protein [Schumannella soli]
MEHLAPAGWALLVVAALVVGISKTATAGAGTVAVAIFAAVVPAREATACLLLLLIVGDVTALLSYRRHAEWRLLVRLIPMVVAGIALGAIFLFLVDDGVARKVIGVILLLLVGITLWSRRRSRVALTAAGSAASASSVSGAADGSGGSAGASGTTLATASRAHRAEAIAFGTLGGFTTMVANAGGPVMSLYFLALRFDVLTFLGTSAWFFAVVNLAKLPIVIGLGLLSWSSALLVLCLAPAVLLGALGGRWLARRLTQTQFTRIVLALTVVGALYLLVR